MNRFIGAIARKGQLRPIVRLGIQELGVDICTTLLIDLPHVVLAASGLSAIMLNHGDLRGAVLGTMFRKEQPGRIDRLGDAEILSIADTRGRQLFDHFWGHYVAVIALDDRIDILRAPFGELALCWFKTSDTIFFGSDLRILALCGCDVRSIAWDGVARHLAEADIRRDDTCLRGVYEVRGGNCLTVAAGNAALRTLWSPWSREDRIGSATAAHRLRATIDRCVADKVSEFRQPLLLLSGGLDSSIIASALVTAGKPPIALNLVTEDRSGDERDYARTVAETFGLHYFEEVRQIENVDLLRSDAAWLPRPSLRSFLQDSRQLTNRVAGVTGADVIIEGSGGDNVFCSLQSVGPVADRIRCGGTLNEVIESARDIADLTDATMLTVLRRAIYRAWFRRTAYRLLPDHSLLSPLAIALSAGATDHPWLQDDRRNLSGKVGHIAMLVAAQGWVECLDPMSLPPTLGPLLAQPIVETCFAIPSWQWFSEGQNRVIAREAYRNVLPDIILDRRSKATPDSFVTQLYNRHRPLLVELLLDGHLVHAGLLDRASLESALRHDGPPLDHVHRRIMRIADVEVWIRARLATQFNRRF